MKTKKSISKKNTMKGTSYELCGKLYSIRKYKIGYKV